MRKLSKDCQQQRTIAGLLVVGLLATSLGVASASDTQQSSVRPKIVNGAGDPSPPASFGSEPDRVPAVVPWSVAKLS